MSDGVKLEYEAYSYATEADVRNPDWSLVTRRAAFRRCTVADLLAWCEERGQEPGGVEVSGGSISYRETETEAEREKRHQQIANADARHEEWERETYLRLRAKFEQEGGQG